jgi:uncharacterized membrane protein YqaE (UPF0057 family)
MKTILGLFVIQLPLLALCLMAGYSEGDTLVGFLLYLFAVGCVACIIGGAYLITRG